MFKIEGKIVRIGEIETLKNDFQKIDVTIEETDSTDKIPSQLNITYFGDNYTMMLDNRKVGDQVKASYVTKVTEYNGKRYNNVSGRDLRFDHMSTISLDDDLPF